MFMETDRTQLAGRMAEGAYWLFVALAVAFTTPGLTWMLALVLQEKLAYPAAWILDQWYALVAIPFAALSDVGKVILPASWDRWAAVWGHPIGVFSFGGGAYVAAWYVAALQRGFGSILGIIFAAAMMCALGMTILGITYLVIAYMIIFDGFWAVWFFRSDGNNMAIALPLLVPPVLAALLLAVNALL